MLPLTQASIVEAIGNDSLLQKCAEQMAKEVEHGSYNILIVCEKLSFALSSNSVAERVQGTLMYSRVLAQLPKDLLRAEQLEVLATFYASRLRDHHNILPAVFEGIEALVHMRNFPGTGAVMILRNLFMHTTCQSQLRSDRFRIFGILKHLSENFVKELKDMAGDFLYGVISCLDGERDPRNLNFIFTFMPDFVATYPLLHLSEEVFEIFACYFPIDFTPTRIDPDTLTRDDLSRKLIKCLVSSPDFVEWAVHLAVEKLGSELLTAKSDSLELMYECAMNFPCESMEPHFPVLWNSIKSELFPGGDNRDIKSQALHSLRSILAQASSVNTSISHNYQTQVLATILPHLSDVNHRLFDPAATIALVCVAGDPIFATEKIVNAFLIKLSEDAATIDSDQTIRIYKVIAQSFNVVSAKGAELWDSINSEVCSRMHSHVIAALRRVETENRNTLNLDVLRFSLMVLKESAPIITEVNRVLTYKVLVAVLTHDSIDLEETQALITRLAALQPIELQSNCIDGCIRNFALFSNFVKNKIYQNLLPLVKQMAFTGRVMDLIYQQSFSPNIPNDARLSALKALNKLLQSEDERFIIEMQHNTELIDKLVCLALGHELLNPDILSQIALAISAVIQTLPISEQYVAATRYLHNLNLQVMADLYVAKGLLGFLHKDISLDDHFERLLDDLTDLSLRSDNETMREVAHHMLCSLVNKIHFNDSNRNVLQRTIAKLKDGMTKGNRKAVQALSWLGKGLVMRGSEEASDIVEALSELLDHPSLSTVAALAFDVISAEYPQLHLPVVKYLFKQKFFHMILKKLGHKLETYCEHHLVAFVYVLKTTPHAVLKMNLQRIGPFLFKCLETDNIRIIGISLQICGNFIKQRDEYFRGHLAHLVPACLKLTSTDYLMKIRISALNLLYDVTKYPTFVLLPLKMDTVLDLAMALDDPKRLVRTAAVKARNAWYLVGAPRS